MRRPLLRGLVLHGGGSAAVAAVGLVRNVLIARVMGPAAFGLWQGCLVALRLAGECHLGALHALALDAPVLRAAGRVEEAGSLERRAVALCVLLSLPPALAAGWILRWQGGGALGPAAALLAGAFLGWSVFQAEAAVLRTRGRFGTLAILQVTFAAVHLTGLLLLLPDRYLSGALAAWGGGVAAALVVAAFAAKERLPLPLPTGVAGAGGLLRRGGTTWLVGLTFLLFFQVDRVLVGGILGREALGHYGILLIGGTALLFLPDVLAGVLWPLAGERFGRSGGRPESLGGVAEETLRGLGRVLACLMLLGFQATDLLVRVVLPGFQEALEPLRAYLPGVYFLCLAIPLRTLLVTVRADRDVLGLQVGILLLAVAGEAAAALLGGGILGVAVAASAGGLLLFVALLRRSVRLLGFGTGWIPTVAKGMMLAAGALSADRALALGGVPSAASFAGSLLRFGLPLVLAALAAAPLLRLREGGGPGDPSPAAGPDAE